jgi:PAS domain S-box-containing protein
MKRNIQTSSYEFSGHFLIITGFFYFYLGLYKSSVELPYEKLAISEEKLRHSAEEKYRRLFDNANDAVVTIDMDGRVTSWNKSAEKLFGWTVGEITGKRLIEVISTPETVAEKEKMICELLSDTITGMETVWIRKDSTKINLSVTVSPLLDVNRNFVERSLIIRDITECKQMENALRASEEKFEKVFRSSPQALTITGLNDGRFIEVNDSFTSNLGYSREEAIGHTTLELGIWITHKDRIRFVDTLKENRFVRNTELDMRTKKGETVSMLVSAEMIDVEGKACMLSTFFNITERKQAEDALQESEERLHQAVRVSQIGIFDQDHRTDIIYWSPEQRHIYGFGQEEPVTLSAFLMHLYPEDSERITKAVRCAHDPAGDGSFDVEHRIVDRNGSIHWVRTQSCTHFEGEGSSRHPVRTVGAAADITERKSAEEKIEASLKEKEILLREIHHRVKNNMQIVSSLLMLQSYNIEVKKYKDMFIESQTRIYSMALIHEKLFQSESIAQINFKEYIEGIISNIFESYCIKSNIKIDINVENIPINIDYAVPCGLIINELVTNSLKYAFPDERNGKIQISLKSNDNKMIHLSISDDGIGIPKDMDIRKTKSLGLHLVTALAESQLHGKIILNRENGTQFQIGFGAK